MTDVSVLEQPVEVVEITAPAAVLTVVTGHDPAAVQVITAPAAIIEAPAADVDVVQIVTAGPRGPQGDIGPQGPPGFSTPVFEQRFISPETVWVIVHNLGDYPIVTTYDLSGDELTGDVSYVDLNTVTVTFALPFAGIARLKA